jgi:hypothetical protein
MWSLLFFVLMIVVFGKILKFAIKATWGVAKIMVTLVFLPVILVGLVLAGLLTLALPILVVIGIVAFIVLND